MTKEKIVRNCSLKNCEKKHFAKGFCKSHYSQIPENKARRKELEARPEYRAKAKERQSTPEYKAKAKDLRDRPESKARAIEREQTPERKARRKEIRDRPENKAKAKERQSRPENKAKARAYGLTSEVRVRQKARRDNTRLKILQYYSKLLSNSDIPCCNCPGCGENSHTEFLALDHIAGRKQMDSELELVKKGYRSSLTSYQLHSWVERNNFPEGFQVLCHNCNSAKGFYGKCPHEK